MTEKPAKAGSETRVLVIDDEEIVHRSVGKILARAGLSSTSAFTAKEALEHLGEERFDLVITDLMMPEMNGIELLQELKGAGIQVPIIMITGYPTIATALQAMRCGARDYLAKPFTRKELLSPVMRALRQEPKEEAEVEASPPETGIAPSSLVPGDTFCLTHHAWAEFQQDGHFLVGVEPTFLAAAGTIERIDLPTELELVDQGTVGIRLTSAEGEEHGVAMPISGQVTLTNRELVGAPSRLTAEDWLLRILPSHLDTELANLARR